MTNQQHKHKMQSSDQNHLHRGNNQTRKIRLSTAIMFKFNSISFLILATSLVAITSARDIKEQNQKIQTIGQNGRIIKRHSENDFPPKLIHQPQSVSLDAHEPHTIECPVESRPDSEIKWFKDDQLLMSQPPHLEQTGSELMFFSMNDEDTGEYHCQATNYLGSITSDRFRLTVKSDNQPNQPSPPPSQQQQPDLNNQPPAKTSNIQLEPAIATVGLKDRVEFICTIPLARTSQRQPEVGWRRNGKRLQVKWTSEENDSRLGFRYLARQKSLGEFVLIVHNAQLSDNNATFICDVLATNEPESGELTSGESNLARLFVRADDPIESSPPTNQQVELDVQMGPPIDNLASKRPHELANQTTKLIGGADGDSMKHQQKSLADLLNDFYELAKPALVLFGLLSLIGFVVGLQLLVIKRRNRCENRYMKHQYAGSASAGSGSSGAHSALAVECDPVLSSLLQRTLSAPNANSLAGSGANKKSAYRSYRDHMRKVVAQSDTPHDLIDGSAYFNQQELGFNPLALPNLYNQSLAAREQARNLLQAGDHMRSLSNLNQKQHQQMKHHHNTQQFRQFQTNGGNHGSHLNLPLSFAFEQQANRLLDGPSQIMSATANAFWPPHHSAANMRGDEHYQLVNCSNTSTSNSSSTTESSSNESSNNKQAIARKQQTNQGSVSMDHYTSIDANEEENRYEELDSRVGKNTSRLDGSNKCTSSSFVTMAEPNSRQQRMNPIRSSFNSNSSSSGRGTSSSTGTSADHNQLPKLKFAKTTTAPLRPQKFHQDQLSPYAVSSICHQQQQSSSSQPINANEAMRALSEQFDINQLMLMDDDQQQQLPFNLPPPPPQPPQIHMDTKKD